MNVLFIDVGEDKEYWPTTWVFLTIHKEEW